MKIICCCLTYGNRPLDTLYYNIVRAGYPATYINVNREGISNAQNDGLDIMLDGGFDGIAFMSNDIVEPGDWLLEKVTNLKELHSAGIVSTTVQKPERVAKNQHIIGNWLMSRECVEKVGYFCESMFPYGPIDLDYCERAWVAGFCTYYVPDIAAQHNEPHAQGNEYGYDKQEMVNKYWPKYLENIIQYRNGTLNYKKERL